MIIRSIPAFGYAPKIFIKKFVTNCHYRSLIVDKEVRLCKTLMKYMPNTFRKYINLCLACAKIQHWQRKSRKRHFLKLLKILTDSNVIVNSALGCARQQKTPFTATQGSITVKHPIEIIISDENIEEQFADKETAYAIHKVLHKLSEPYKEVFWLRIFGELSFAQIGELFSKTESWARVTYYRAKIMIKEELQ